MLNDHQLRTVLLENYHLNGNEAMMYFIIRDLNYFSGECFASNEWFAEELNISVYQIKNILSKLKSLGLILTTTDATKGCIKKRYIYAKEEWIQVKVAKEEVKERRNKIKEGKQVIDDSLDDYSRGCQSTSYNSTRLIAYPVRGCQSTSYEVVSQPINNKYINNKNLNNKDYISIDDNQNDERNIETDLSDSSNSTGIPDLTSLLADSEAQQILEGSRPLTPPKPTGCPPLSPTIDSLPKSVRNHAQKKSNSTEPISTLGVEEKNELSERKPIDLELTTNPTNDTIKNQWNEIAREYGLPQIQVLTEGRLRKVKVAIKAVGGIDKWCEGIRSQLSQSPFHRGENDRGWRANFDYYSRSDKALAALETIGTRSPAKKSSFESAFEMLYGNGVEGIEWKS